MKFSYAIQNPPYSIGNGTASHIYFLRNILKFSERIISVQPISFLYYKYKLSAASDIYSMLRNFGCTACSLEDNIFDCAVRNKLGIIYIDTTSKHPIIIDNKEYTDIFAFKFSNDHLLTEFNDIIQPLYQKDNLKDHFIDIDPCIPELLEIKQKDSLSDKYFVRIAKIRGNIGRRDNFTLIPRDRAPETGQRNNSYINFDTEYAAQNFINYCKTDFVSGILYLFKISIPHTRFFKYIPYFDFKDEIFSKTPGEIDDYLFKKFNISDDIRKYLETLFPDYYNIRK